MDVEVLPDRQMLGSRAAALIAERAAGTVRAHGRFSLAVSGGSTPNAMFEALAGHRLPWERIHLFQVDERVAPDGDPDRNLVALRRRLLSQVALPPTNTHLMPVTAADLPTAARRYSAELRRVCGDPPVLDLVHLGLGDDGHTASLAPGDPVLDVTAEDVALSAPYRGRVRMTLTLPALNRAARILWLVGGAAKAPALRRLLAGDRTIPAARVRTDAAILLADRAAARELDPRPVGPDGGYSRGDAAPGTHGQETP
ncbi:MAG: 6-phosphogluconolactonase [Actinomycetota bacterium]|nr:6-phosphogluconolactonase [Actinomycetota bacterium]